MNISFRLALFYGLFFVAGGVMLPFWPVWLEAKGLDKNQIGLALAIPAWMRVVGSLFWLRLAPHYSSYRYLLMTLLVFSLISYVLFSLVDSVTFILIIAAAAAFFYTPILPFTDHLTVRVSQMYKLDYGRIRLWGYIFFMMASMGSGMILKGQNPDWVLYTILMALALPIISIKLIPNMTESHTLQGRNSSYELFKNRFFLNFLLVTSLLQGSHAILYVCGTLHWRDHGLSKDVIGLLWAEGVVAEIIVFALGARIFRYFSPLQALLIGGIAAIIRWITYGFTANIEVLVPSQLLHGFTFGLNHLAAMRFLVLYIPDQLAMSGQAIYGGVSTGLMMGVALLAAGSIYELFQGDGFFIMAIMAVVALGFLALLARQLKRQPLG